MRTPISGYILKLAAKVKLTGKLETFLRQAPNDDAMQVVFRPRLKGDGFAKRLDNDWVQPLRSQGERFQVYRAQLPNLGVLASV